MSARVRTLALVLVAALSLPLLAPPASAGQTINGDLVVDGTNVVTIDTTTVTVLGNIIVKDQGKLVVTASQLILRQDVDFQYAVRVLGQGNLVLQSGSTLGSNRFYATTVQDQGTLLAADSNLLGNNPQGGVRSTLTARGASSLQGTNTVFSKLIVQLRGASTGLLTGATFDMAGELTTWDTARLTIDGGLFPLDYPNGKANGASTISIRHADLKGWAFMASDTSTLTIEDSSYGYAGSLFTNYLYFDGSPQVTWRNLTLAQNANFVLRGNGDYLIDHSTGIVIPSTAEVLGIPSQARSLRVLASEVRLGASQVGYLEVDATSKVHLSPARTQLGPYLLIAGQANVDHLLARAGSTIDVVSQGDVITLGQLNDECYGATLLPVGTKGYAQQYYNLPIPGAGAFVPLALAQTLTVHVKRADGSAVPGATVSLTDLTGAAANVFDPATGGSSAQRATDASGAASYLFAPTGVLNVAATAPGGASGTARAITAQCTSVDVTVG